MLGAIEPETSLPDHSLLTWDFLVDTNRKLPNTDNEQDVRVSFTKFDRNVPDDFLSARHNEINEYINTLEGDVATQEHINKVYSDQVVL